MQFLILVTNLFYKGIILRLINCISSPEFSAKFHRSKVSRGSPGSAWRVELRCDTPLEADVQICCENNAKVADVVATVFAQARSILCLCTNLNLWRSSRNLDLFSHITTR